MKQIIITSLLFLSCCAANSQYQTQKGKWMIYHSIISGGPLTTESRSYENGQQDYYSKEKSTNIYGDFMSPWWGGVNFDRQKYEIAKPGDRIDKDFDFDIQPQAGYFIKNNFMIGAAFRGSLMLSSEREEGYKKTDRGWDLGLGPIARYYFGKNTKGRPVAGFETRFDIGRGKYRKKEDANGNTETAERDYKRSGIWIKPYAGYSFFLGKRWSADLFMSYSFEQSDEKTESREYTNNNMKTGYPKFYRTKWNDKEILLSVGISYTF